MNNVKRRAIKKIEEKMESLIRLKLFNSKIFESLAMDIEMIRDEEEFSFESLSEGLQCSGMGMAMEDAMGYLEEARDCLEALDDNDSEELVIEQFKYVIEVLSNARYV